MWLIVVGSNVCIGGTKKGECVIGRKVFVVGRVWLCGKECGCVVGRV